MTIKVTKVNRKLGLAVDGGSNTRQNGIIIRQITVSESGARNESKKYGNPVQSALWNPDTALF